MERIRELPAKCDRLICAARAVDGVSVALQRDQSERPDLGLVFHEKDGFIATQLSFRHRASIGKERIDLRKVDLERCAAPDFAVHPDPATVLFDDPINSGQPQPRAGPLRFRGEERLQKPLSYLPGATRAVVAEPE